jgi:uncharacterized protein (DUF427 family)
MPRAAKKRETTPAQLSVRAVGGRVRVRFGTFVLADTEEALLLQHGEDTAIFVPRRELPAEFLHDDGRSGPPRAGLAARYWSYSIGGYIASNGTWSFDKPQGGLAELAAYIAFDPPHAQIEIEAAGTGGAAVERTAAASAPLTQLVRK